MNTMEALTTAMTSGTGTSVAATPTSTPVMGIIGSGGNKSKIMVRLRHGSKLEQD